MSAKVVELRPGKWPPDRAAVIAGNVNLFALKAALNECGLVARLDEHDRLVIEPAEDRSEGRWQQLSESEYLVRSAEGRRADAEAKARRRWYNGLSRVERAHWHRIAGSTAPADAWAAFKAAEAVQPD